MFKIDDFICHRPTRTHADISSADLAEEIQPSLFEGNNYVSTISCPQGLGFSPAGSAGEKVCVSLWQKTFNDFDSGSSAMHIKKFVQKALVFLLLNCFILAGVLYFFSGRERHVRMNNWETESNLLAMGENELYGMALLGTSRGRVLSRDGNHRMLEKILGRKVMNLSKGGGGGLMPAELHLSYFYHRGNRADQIVYLVDPWVFFSPVNNENNTFFLRDEPFELFILAKLILDRYPWDRIASYLQMIAVKDWAAISRYEAPGLTQGELKVIDTEKIAKAKEHYLSKYDVNGFKRYSRYVEHINALVNRNGGRIAYVMLPMLISDFPGMDHVDRLLRESTAGQAHVTYYNFSGAMQEKRFFYDHMHFNKTGIEYFTRNCLYPLLHGGQPTL
jgi:hypothetical protein